MTSFTRPTLITITAPTCSGKSYLLDKLAYNGTVSRIVSTTTRPIRNGEKAGIDYDFISMEQSLELESAGRFFELITFNGTRYGVTHEQMASAMSDARPPAVVLEPQGLEIYTQKCRENGWDVFKVYVHTIESERISRLHYRTVNQMWAAIDPAVAPSLTSMGDVFREMATERLKASIGPIIREHDRRLLSITGEERRWQNSTCWDAIVPGDDVEKAIAMIEQGIQWRNTRVTAGFN